MAKYCIPLTCENTFGTTQIVPIQFICNDDQTCSQNEDEDEIRCLSPNGKFLRYKDNPQDGTHCKPQCDGKPCTATEMTEAWANMGNSCP